MDPTLYFVLNWLVVVPIVGLSVFIGALLLVLGTWPAPKH